MKVNRLSLAVFAAGMLALLAGAFTVGIASAGGAQAAPVRYEHVVLNYLAPYQPGNSMGSCGRLPGPGSPTSVVRIGELSDQRIYVCQASFTIVR